MKILVAIDGSPTAEAAARFVKRLPSRTPLDIDLLMVVNPPDTAMTTSTELWFPQYIEYQIGYAKEILARSALDFEGTTARVETHYTQGHIGHAIAEHAQQVGADLIVVGAKGHSTLGRILLGSVSDYVATHATCSVLVFRPDSCGPDGTPHRISIAYDNTEPSEVVLQKFAQFQWASEEQIQVVTATPELEVFHEDISTPVMEEGARRRSDALRTCQAAAQRLRDQGFSASANSIETEHIGEGILHAADEHQSQMIVIGDAQRSTLTRLLLGSTSRFVLRHAKQSVWIIREKHETKES